jgi:hypothetical protein
MPGWKLKLGTDGELHITDPDRRVYASQLE